MNPRTRHGERMTIHPTPRCARCGTTDDVGPVTWKIEDEDGSIKEIVEMLCHDCDELAHEFGDGDAN